MTVGHAFVVHGPPRRPRRSSSALVLGAGPGALTPLRARVRTRSPALMLASRRPKRRSGPPAGGDNSSNSGGGDGSGSSSGSGSGGSAKSAGGGSASRRRGRAGAGGPARAAGAGATATPGARDEDEAYLTSLFSEDVKAPLASPAAGGKKSRRRAERRAKAQQKAADAASTPDVAALADAVRARVPKSRDEWLYLLVRGAWIGIGGLVALFFLTHLVFVRDWLPPPTSPPPAPSP